MIENAKVASPNLSVCLYTFCRLSPCALLWEEELLKGTAPGTPEHVGLEGSWFRVRVARDVRVLGFAVSGLGFVQHTTHSSS